MHHPQYSGRQTSARLIIAAALVLLLPVTECAWMVAPEAEGDGDPQLNAIYFNVLISEGMDVNSQAELLQKALDGVQVRTAMIGKVNEDIEQQLAQVLSMIHQNMVKLPLSTKTRTAMHERMLQIIQPILTELISSGSD